MTKLLCKILAPLVWVYLLIPDGVRYLACLHFAGGRTSSTTRSAFAQLKLGNLHGAWDDSRGWFD